ncbi:spermidine/putrescine ABC transporter permease [Entomoplasma ellychniae]|uniref:Spermidine/putrescine ABC transporter permease n=1 Tax=Entomoplasma ellychniae TaxID=2114 RepID=A0A8E2UAG6_9MOLU|nr:spermidine/putrescine ABC transporter permease [Entomoplasma ellychniae]PPE04380.1 spermidine/putrescine ABC transporter permease [Entomoplasma ellychniae]
MSKAKQKNNEKELTWLNSSIQVNYKTEIKPIANLKNDKIKPLTKKEKQDLDSKFKEEKRLLKLQQKAKESFDKDELEEEIDLQIAEAKKQSIKDRVQKYGGMLKSKSFFHKIGKKTTPILLPFFIVMIFLVILPIVAIIIYSVIQPTNDLSMFKVTLQNYLDLFSNKNIMLALGVTLFYALISSLMCILIGYPIALIMSQLRSKMVAKNVWLLVTLPMWISMIMKVLGFRSLFLLLAPSMLGTQVAIIIGMTYMFLPFAIPPIYDALESRIKDIEEAAQDLGCSKNKTFWVITLRSSVPGIITAFTLVLLQTATSLIVVQYMGDGKINLISKIIESYFLKGSNFGAGAAISVVLAAIVLIIMLASKFISNKFENKGGKKWKDSSNQVTLL